MILQLSVLMETEVDGEPGDMITINYRRGHRIPWDSLCVHYAPDDTPETLQRKAQQILDVRGHSGIIAESPKSIPNQESWRDRPPLL